MSTDTRQVFRPMISTALNLFVFLVLFRFLAPVQFGGTSTYLILIGNSMEPKFHQGDLVVLRQQRDYQIGDIVAYEYPELGTVFHRIVDVDNGKYVMQGDNNDFLDPYTPAPEEVLARFWLHLPNAGKVMKFLRSPMVLPIFVIFSTGLMAFLILHQPKKRAPKSAAPRPAPLNEKPMIKSEFSPNQDMLILLTTVLLISLAVTVYAFVQPTTEMVTVPIDYSHNGVFSYTAPVPADLFNDGLVRSGEPLFRNLVSGFTVTFDYQFQSAEAVTLAGTYDLLMEISEPNGWRKTYRLLGPVHFSGTEFTAVSYVDFGPIQQIIDNLEAQTLVSRTEYTMTIYPDISLVGQLNGALFEDTFTPSLQFTFNDTMVSYKGESSLGEPIDAFHPIKGGNTLQMEAQKTTVNLLGAEVGIGALRTGGIIGLVISGSVLGYLVWQIVRPRLWMKRFLHQNDYAIEPMKLYNSKEPRKRLVEVSSLRAIALIADREGQQITHIILGSMHHFFVRSTRWEDVLYHFERPISEADQPLELELKEYDPPL